MQFASLHEAKREFIILLFPALFIDSTGSLSVIMLSSIYDPLAYIDPGRTLLLRTFRIATARFHHPHALHDAPRGRLGSPMPY